MRRSSSRAMRTRIVCSARASRRAIRGAPVAVKQRAAGQLELGPEVVQMPLQRVVERDALADQPLAVIDEQPQVELGAVQLRGRQRIQALAQRRPGDRDRVDAVGLPALASAAPRRRPSACVVTRSTRSPRPIRNRSNDPETCRQSSIAQTRSPSRPRAQTQQRREALARRPGPSARPPTRRSPPRPRRSCASACECPHRARSLTLVHLHLD